MWGKKVWLSRFTKTADGTGPAMYVGFDGREAVAENEHGEPWPTGPQSNPKGPDAPAPGETWGPCRFCGETRPLAKDSDLCTWCYESMHEPNPRAPIDWQLKQRIARRMTEAELRGALADVRKTLPYAESMDKAEGPPAWGSSHSGYYNDEASIYAAELERRCGRRRHNPGKQRGRSRLGFYRVYGDNGHIIWSGVASSIKEALSIARREVDPNAVGTSKPWGAYREKDIRGKENPSWRVTGTLEQVPDAAAPTAPRRRGRPPKLAVVPPPTEPEAPAAEASSEVPFEVPGEAVPRRGFEPGERVTVPYTGRESYFGRQTSRTRDRAIVEGYHLEGAEPMVQVRVLRGRGVEDRMFPERLVRRRPRSRHKVTQLREPAIRARLERKVRGDLAAAEALREKLGAEYAQAEAVAREWYGFKPKWGETNKAFHNARAKMIRTEEKISALDSIISELGGGVVRAADAFANPHGNRHGAVGSARTVRGIRRKRNPGGSERERAVRTFKMWHEFEPHRVTRMKGPPRLIPKTLVKLGEIRAIDYISDKWEGRPVTYTHKTDRPRPVLATDPDGRHLHIIGGRVKVTADGLVH
jgi:hypothetical protein